MLAKTVSAAPIFSRSNQIPAAGGVAELHLDTGGALGSGLVDVQCGGLPCRKHSRKDIGLYDFADVSIAGIINTGVEVCGGGITDDAFNTVRTETLVRLQVAYRFIHGPGFWLKWIQSVCRSLVRSLLQENGILVASWVQAEYFEVRTKARLRCHGSFEGDDKPLDVSVRRDVSRQSGFPINLCQRVLRTVDLDGSFSAPSGQVMFWNPSKTKSVLNASVSPACSLREFSFDSG